MKSDNKTLVKETCDDFILDFMNLSDFLGSIEYWRTDMWNTELLTKFLAKAIGGALQK